MFVIEFLSSWIPNSPTGYIIAGFIAVLLIYLAYWLVYSAVRLAYWLTSESLRITFFSLAVLHYTLWVVFVSAPFRLLFRQRTIGDVIDTYMANLKMTFFIFYPQVEKEINKRKKKVKAPAKHVHHHHHISHPKPNISKDIKEEISAETQIIHHKKPVSINPKHGSGKFFCTNCGDVFTSAMFETLNRKSHCFCEGCGKRFENIKGVPTPTK